jgi:hypothetical protein
LKGHFGAVGRGFKGQVIAKADDKVRVAVLGFFQFLNLLCFDPEFVCQCIKEDLFQMYLFENTDCKFANVTFLIVKTFEFFVAKF